ncbi:mannonate dehydratase [Pelobacter seleniigenes]|uniref:mannonate dehydratase n=1 Tax=Pelobacter seleniigenes TaxID=407188 RepID=UPI0004A6E527|nr:mannonate dehydratase [Pelobacter seleniigenes]
MRQTWRWFGPADRTSIDDILQAGVEGVVSALHHIPPGVVWTREEIAKRQEEIACKKDGSPSGLTWEVVESLPVSEGIKKQTGAWREHIEHYKTSLRNLAAQGIEVICYNFMPVLDWTRTDLKWRMPHGGTTMRFDLIDFAAFDIFLLQRAGAAEEFPPEIVAQAEKRFAGMSEQLRQQITENVACGLPGSTEQLTLPDIRRHLAEYDRISPQQLRQHFIDFLAEVAPCAQELGLRLCCHPDDPPFPLLGLPRIVSTEEDYATLLAAVDVPANGITLCAGSLGARADNDLPGMIDRLGDRVHFVHLRNVKREAEGVPTSFHEDEHLRGDTDMVALVQAILRQEDKRRAAGRKDCCIPIRPDHGMDILDDLNRQGQPGYPSIGRLKGLAELRGLITALTHPSITSKG